MHVRLLAWYGWWRGEAEIRLLPRLCDRERCSLDIGANRGMYAAHMLRWSHGCELFEPNPELCRFLQAAFGARVGVHQLALSDQHGAATLVVPTLQGREIDTSASLDRSQEELAAAWEKFDGARIVAVPMVTLDSVAIPGVGFIKIDVEGHELRVLRGAERVLRDDRPNLLVEIEERHHPNAVRSTSGFLGAREYEGYFLSEGRIHPLAAFDPARHQRPGAAARSYVNNFIFVPAESASARDRLLR